MSEAEQRRMPDWIKADATGATATGGNVNNSGIGTTAAVVLGIVAGLAMGMAIYAQVMANQAERESRMLEYYVLEMDAKLIAGGLKRPEDSVADKLKERRK